VDEDVIKEVKWKESVNENNVLGLNLQLYESMKPNNSIRLKIKNFIDEYYLEWSIDSALKEAKECCEKNKIDGFVFVGYVLIKAFSNDEAGFKEILNILIHFFKEGFMTKKDMLEGFHLSL